MTPLRGWRVLVARPADRTTELADALTAAGAEVLAVPLISIGPPSDPGQFDLALLELAAGDHTWVGFTSATAVDAVLRRALALGLEPAVPADTRVAVVGPGTARAARAAGLPVDLMPGRGGSAAALAAIWPRAAPGQSVLLPRSDRAAATLPDALVALGYRVTAVDAYRTETVAPPDDVAEQLRAGAVHAVLLTSPSAVLALHGAPRHPGVALGAIGAPTEQAIRSAGWSASFVAEQPTPAGLVSGLVRWAAARGTPTAAVQEVPR